MEGKTQQCNDWCSSPPTEKATQTQHLPISTEQRNTETQAHFSSEINVFLEMLGQPDTPGKGLSEYPIKLKQPGKALSFPPHWALLPLQKTQGSGQNWQRNWHRQPSLASLSDPKIPHCCSATLGQQGKPAEPVRRAKPQQAPLWGAPFYMIVSLIQEGLGKVGKRGRKAYFARHRKKEKKIHYVESLIPIVIFGVGDTGK